MKLVHAAFFEASKALPSSSTYTTNDNDPKSTPPMDPSVCIYFGRWPLQESRQQRPVSAAIQHLSAVDFSDATVRGAGIDYPTTHSHAPQALELHLLILFQSISLVLLWERGAGFLTATHLSVLHPTTQASHRLGYRFAWSRLLYALQDSFRK